MLLIKVLGAALLTAVFLVIAPGVAAADPEETLASDCRNSDDEFTAEWISACLDQE